MTVSAETEAHIRRLFFGEHWKRGTIATQLAIHYDVVERVIGRVGPCLKAPTPSVPESLCTFAAFIFTAHEKAPISAHEKAPTIGGPPCVWL